MRGISGWRCLSVAIWVAANMDHRLTLPNTLDGKGWYFNPFTWQLLFTVGAALAVLMARQAATAGAVAPADLLPRFRWLAALAGLILDFCLLPGGAVDRMAPSGSASL